MADAYKKSQDHIETLAKQIYVQLVLSPGMWNKTPQAIVDEAWRRAEAFYAAKESVSKAS